MNEESQQAAGPPTMPATTALEAGSDPPHRLPDLLQTVLTGLILAFVFRAFLVEPFIIPTGSMASTLLGAHATHACPACGWEFDFAPLRATTPSGEGFEVPPEVVCPNCQLHIAISPQDTAPKAGDRIVVHKWPYALGGYFAPKPWDVIVFRDPADPAQHYIKRLVGLPGEAVEIVDGDVYVNGRIRRKPEHVQRDMWLVVFDQAHIPSVEFDSGAGARWIVRDPPASDASGWTGMDSRVIRYDGLDDTPRRLVFNPDAGGSRAVPEYLLDMHAYNRRSSGVYVRDVRLVAELTLDAGSGALRAELTRPPLLFYAELHADGRVRLGQARNVDGAAFELQGRVSRESLRRPVAFEFAHVDQRVYVRLNGTELLTSHDTDYVPNLQLLRASPGDRPVGLGLVAEGLRLELRGLRIDRDVHYTTHGPYTRRAFPGTPFRLREGEYFVLGDNSADSHDSREWFLAGPHLPVDYRLGTVRADQLVGQAAFVYLPGLLPVTRDGRWAVPDVGRMRFIR